MRSFQKLLLTYISANAVALMLLFAILGSQTELSDDQSYGAISVEEAKMLIESNPLLIVVDVRTAAEFSLGHIEGAINLCVCDEEELLRGLEPQDEILVYCLTGTRSTKAMMILNENGYRRVYNMLGGITEWIEKGYPIVG